MCLEMEMNMNSQQEEDHPLTLYPLPSFANPSRSRLKLLWVQCELHTPPHQLWTHRQSIWGHRQPPRITSYLKSEDSPSVPCDRLAGCPDKLPKSGLLWTLAARRARICAHLAQEKLSWGLWLTPERHLRLRCLNLTNFQSRSSYSHTNILWWISEQLWTTSDFKHANPCAPRTEQAKDQRFLDMA